MLFLMPLLSKEENIKKHIRKFSGRFLRKKKKFRPREKSVAQGKTKQGRKHVLPYWFLGEPIYKLVAPLQMSKISFQFLQIMGRFHVMNKIQANWSPLQQKVLHVMSNVLINWSPVQCFCKDRPKKKGYWCG